MTAWSEEQDCAAFARLARYNRWVNERLYASCETLTDAQRKRDLGAFFGSVHGTLNHLLLTDLMWLGRFTGEVPALASLRDELHAGFDELRAARVAADNALLAFTETLSPARLRAPITFTSVAAKLVRTFPLSTLLTHLFNHQTHHRGQVSVLIQQLGGDYGDIDLLFMPDL